VSDAAAADSFDSGPLDAGHFEGGSFDASQTAAYPEPLVTPEPATSSATVPRRSGDLFMCRLLCVPTGAQRVRERDVQRLFRTSIFLSALRCLLTYVLLPFLGPVLGLAGGVGPAIGLPLAVIALVFDVLGVRRFWIANHRSRWSATFVYAGVMALVLALMVIDITDLLH